MNSQIRKKFLSKLLSHFYWKMFPLAPLFSKGSGISVLRFHTNRARPRPHEIQLQLSELNSHITKRFLRKLLSLLRRSYLWSWSATVCPIADSAKTLLASFSVVTMMDICGLKSPTTKKFLRRLLCRFL